MVVIEMENGFVNCYSASTYFCLDDSSIIITDSVNNIVAQAISLATVSRVIVDGAIRYKK